MFAFNSFFVDHVIKAPMEIKYYHHLGLLLVDILYLSQSIIAF